MARKDYSEFWIFVNQSSLFSYFSLNWSDLNTDPIWIRVRSSTLGKIMVLFQTLFLQYFYFLVRAILLLGLTSLVDNWQWHLRVEVWGRERPGLLWRPQRHNPQRGTGHTEAWHPPAAYQGYHFLISLYHVILIDAEPSATSVKYLPPCCFFFSSTCCVWPLLWRWCCSVWVSHHHLEVR